MLGYESCSTTDFLHKSSPDACAPEQLLQVVRQLGAAPIALASWVERDKDARILVHIHLLLKEHHGLGLVLQSTLQCEFAEFGGMRVK